MVAFGNAEGRARVTLVPPVVPVLVPGVVLDAHAHELLLVDVVQHRRQVILQAIRTRDRLFDEEVDRLRPDARIGILRTLFCHIYLRVVLAEKFYMGNFASH